MSLYQKHRPQLLEELVGNEATIEGIVGHFAQPQHLISHSHIIHGDSGCGKTTLARAIARSILKATDFSIREINTADNRGIDTAREIIDQMRLVPFGKKVVYIIDEAHGMTADAKRAFLKPLEDCPAHVYFFLCTTNLGQLLKGDEGKAIGTRCTQWKVEPQTPRTLFRLVSRVATAEELEIDEDVLRACAEAANGSPRAALVALEKIIPVKDKDQQLKLLAAEDPEKGETIKFCRALTGMNRRDCLDQLVLLKGEDPEGVRRAVMGYMAACASKRSDAIFHRCLQAFSVPTYDNGWAGLVLSTLNALQRD